VASNVMRPIVIPIVCLAVLCITLTLGLWPFHAPRNHVSWLGNRNGLELRRYATLNTATALSSLNTALAGATLEVWLKPRRIWDGGTFLALYNPSRPEIFSLAQSQLDLELLYQASAGKTAFHVDNVFHENFHNRAVFLAVTSDGFHTTVYVNGAPVASRAAFPFAADTLAGRLILGTAPRQNDDWSGQLYGLAIYRRALAAPDVLRHFQSWTRERRPAINQEDGNSALYLFDERSGSVAHNSAGPDPDLTIPARYEVLDQLLLQPIWDEFEISRSYGGAALKNIVGFIPFGFTFYAWFLMLRWRRAGLIAVLSGLFVSLTIEVLQTFLPTRDSGTTDLLTNAFGTWLGVGLYRLVTPVFNRLIPTADLPEPPNLRTT
jgi:VanZ family protein